MENIKNSISYLKGLMEGMELDCGKKESKLFFAMVDVLDSMSQEMELIKTNTDYCVDMVDEILDDEFNVFAQEDLSFGDCDCDQEDAFDEDDFVEIECPHCHEKVEFEKDTYENSDSLICPSCIQIIE